MSYVLDVKNLEAWFGATRAVNGELKNAPNNRLTIDLLALLLQWPRPAANSPREYSSKV